MRELLSTDNYFPIMADQKNSSPSQNNAPNRVEAPQATLEKPNDPFVRALVEIRNSDGDSSASHDTMAEKTVIGCLNDNISLFTKLPKERQESYVKEIVDIAKKYNKEVSKIQSLCSIALELELAKIRKEWLISDAVQSKYGNEFLDKFRKTSVILENRGINPNRISDVKMLANYFTHLTQNKEEQTKFETWLKSNPTVAALIATTWKESGNTLKYFLDHKDDAKNTLKYIDMITATRGVKKAPDVRDYSTQSLSINPWKDFNAKKTIEPKMIYDLAAQSRVRDIAEKLARDPNYLAEFLVGWNAKSPLYQQLKKDEPRAFTFYENLYKGMVSRFHLLTDELDGHIPPSKLKEKLKIRVEDKLDQAWDGEKARRINIEYATKLQGIFGRAYTLTKDAKIEVSGKEAQQILAEVADLHAQYADEDEWMSKRLNSDEQKTAYQQFRNIRASEAFVKRILYVKEAKFRNILERNGNVANEIENVKKAFDETITQGRAMVVWYTKEKGHFTLSMEEMRKRIREAIKAGNSWFNEGNSLALANFIGAIYEGNGRKLTLKNFREELGNDIYLAYIKNYANSSQPTNTPALSYLRRDNPDAFNAYVGILEEGVKEYRKLDETQKGFITAEKNLLELVKPENNELAKKELKSVLDANRDMYQIFCDVRRIVAKYAGVTETSVHAKVKGILHADAVPDADKIVEIVEKNLELYRGKNWVDLHSFTTLLKKVNDNFCKKLPEEEMARVHQESALLSKMVDHRVRETVNVAEIDLYRKMLVKYQVEDEKIYEYSLSDLLRKGRDKESKSIQLKSGVVAKSADLDAQGKRHEAEKLGAQGKHDADRKVAVRSTVNENLDELKVKFKTNDEAKIRDHVEAQMKTGKSLDSITREARRERSYSSRNFDFFGISSNEDLEDDGFFERGKKLNKKDQEVQAFQQTQANNFVQQSYPSSDYYYHLSVERRIQTPVWEYPIGESIPYAGGYNIINKGSKGIELSRGTEKIAFEAKEEVAAMQLFRLLNKTDLLCFMPHIREMIGSRDQSGIELNYHLKNSSTSIDPTKSNKVDHSAIALNEDDERKILAGLAMTILPDEQKEFDPLKYSQTTGGNAWKNAIPEFKQQMEVATKWRGLANILREQGHLGLDGSLKGVDAIKARWKTKLAELNKQTA